MELEILSAYFPKYLEAFLLTVRIGIIGIGISFILGIIAAFWGCGRKVGPSHPHYYSSRYSLYSFNIPCLSINAYAVKISSLKIA